MASKSKKKVAETTQKVAEKPKEEATHDGQVLIKMTHPFRRFDINGYRFTRDNPYVLMSEEDANHLFRVHRDNHFRPATPQEVEDFYS